MQLKRRPGAGNLRTGLMAATCALLAPAVKAQVPAVEDNGDLNKIDAGLLYYQEDGGRVRSIDAIVKLNHDFGDERVFGMTVAVDSLSGGSPNGAVPQKYAQTFSTPSGKTLQPGVPEDEGKLYTIAPGRQPLDPNFRDLRVAGDLTWSQPLGIGNKVAADGHLSAEHDFLSASGSLQFSRDFNSKNTTLGAGVSLELDQVRPSGDVPVAGSDYTLLQKDGSHDNKHVLGAQLGVTQVLARNWIAQLNFSLDNSGGYLNDPYKILSRVDASGAATGYFFESRPDTRQRRSLYLGNKVALGGSVLDLSYRYGWDDWGIASHTIEARYRLRIGGAMYLEPHLRWYRQDAADFYRLYLTGADPLTGSMSSDPRLAAFTAKTVGLKLGMPLANGDEIAIRLEGYQQDARDRSSALPALSGLDLNPRLRAAVLQLDWRFGF